MRHNNIESISAITFNQQPSMEASMADANNNHNGTSYVGLSMTADGAGSLVSEIKKDEKYSLRQRQSRRTTQDIANVSKATTTTKEKATPKEKPKPKAAPLSKYRRKTANARERSRMREINSAFENLRRAVPVAVAGTSGTSSPVSSPQCNGSAASSEKLTKITTLRLAMKYIRILSDMLHGTTGTLENNNELDMINHNEIEREVMQKGLLLLEGGGYPTGTPGYISSSPAVSPARPPIDPKPSPASSKNNSQQSGPTSSSSPRKRSSNKRTAPSGNSRSKKSTPPSSTPNNPRTRGASGSNGRKTTTTSPTLERIDDNIQLTAPSLLPDPTRPDPLGMDVDLCSVLESDNDSLILSEPCLSPLTAGVGPGVLKSHNFACTNSQSVVPNDGLEFGLFLESDADSLQLSEPCLSPLSHLDSLNPFNDLLHTGFNEQTALELYL
ncbi:helix-loop-helix protein delilah [Anopheles moucheti]|uniref:helix-loop-helix protein delilah n=1 Tax=Anopheles moucheti TaxID=186751 RepID=UPI0022F0C1BF|nr:helix-loop-helix protein delilah [Anopheles moucheti]